MDVVVWGTGGIGSDVVSSALMPAAFGIPGVCELALPLLGLSDPPGSSATLAIDPRSKPVFDTSRVSVTMTDFVNG